MFGFTNFRNSTAILVFLKGRYLTSVMPVTDRLFEAGVESEGIVIGEKNSTSTVNCWTREEAGSTHGASF
jgi:hypothetical protein